MQFVGFWWRVLAYIIDSLILVVAFIVLSMLIPGMMPMPAEGDMNAAMATGGMIGTLMSILVPAVYMVGFNCSKLMGTPGKIILGFAVTDLNGQRIGIGKGILRWIGMFLSSLILGIGYIMVAFTQKKQGLHDMIASTVVVKRASLPGAAA